MVDVTVRGMLSSDRGKVLAGQAGLVKPPPPSIPQRDPSRSMGEGVFASLKKIGNRHWCPTKGLADPVAPYIFQMPGFGATGGLGGVSGGGACTLKLEAGIAGPPPQSDQDFMLGQKAEIEEARS